MKYGSTVNRRAQRLASVALILLGMLTAAGAGCHSSPTSLEDRGYGIDGTFQNQVPASLSPGETVTLHLACRINSTPGGPFHAYLDVYADKNLILQAVAATSSQQPMVTLNGTENPYDNVGVGFYFGPLHAGDVPYVDLVYQVKDPPDQFLEPGGALTAHVGTVLLQDLNLQEGYTHGVAADVYIPIVGSH